MDAWIDSFFGDYDELMIIVRVLLSVILGFILGLEREMYKRPAGLRTHILVCMASCLIMLVSMYGFDSGDPARVAAQVVSGVGFLGAGAIMREDKGNSIKGITTAATIWMSAMIGLSCGNGFYFGAILVTFLALVILTILRNLEKKISASSKYNSKIYMVLENQDKVINSIGELLRECNLLVKDMESKSVTVNKMKAVKMTIVFERDSNIDSLYEFVQKIENEYEPIEIKLSND